MDTPLPPDRIAQQPLARRDSSRLLVLDRAKGAIVHARFSRIGRFLRAGDLLVLNDTLVLPVRIEGRKPSGGRIEITLLDDGVDPAASGTGGRERRALVKTSSGRLREGMEVRLEDGVIAVIHEIGETGLARLEFHGAAPLDYARRHGRMPLPPYIRRRGTAGALAARDRRRYQTVYAAEPGAVAAPTAGLHFTRALIARLEAAGIAVAKITLHVGYGTFAPIRARRLEEHRMHREFYRIGQGAAHEIGRARASGGRIVAVGTTTVRALEAASGANGAPRAGEGWTDLFIRPGYRIRSVDALVTNFHLPGTTPLAMVEAFAGTAVIRTAYRTAVAEGYRFLSYGDAMLIV